MSNQLQITGGAKVRSLEGVITGTTGVLGSLPINGANGIPQLDSSGKILVSQLPNSVMEYLGTWNAATNTPTLANGTGNAGDVYLCNVAGTTNFGAGPITFFVGDQVIYSGTIWQRASGATGTVTSVAVTESGDALSITGSPITTSGTINIGFAGTSAQYVAGDGTLVTFPTIITEAQNLICDVYNNTGATLTKGTIVYINGGHGNLPTVTKALATSDATSAQTFGVVQVDITNNNNGHVVVIGRLENLDTQAYADGTQLYLSSTTAGAWTSTKQYAPAHLVYVGIVVRSHPTQGVVEIKIQNGYELDELHNVYAQSPINGSILQYVNSTSLWTAVDGTTTNIAEGSNLYFTDARVRAALSATTPLSLNSSTGELSISQATASTNGYLSSADWNTFNNKQDALGFVPIGGSGSINYISKFTGSTTISQSGLYEGVTNYVSIGNTNSAYNLDVTGTGRFSDVLSAYSLNADGNGTTGGGINLKQYSSFALGVGYGYTSIYANTSNLIGFTLANSSSDFKLFNFNFPYANGTSLTYTLPATTGTLALTSEIPSLSGYVLGSGSTYQVAWFNATNSIAGESNLYWDAPNNRLGINTSSPSYALDVTGATYSTQGFYVPNSSAISYTTLNGNNGMVVNGSTNIVSLKSGGYETITLNSVGNVGIGNNSPSYILDVSGQARFNSTSGNQVIAYYDASNYANFQHNGIYTKANTMLLGTSLSTDGIAIKDGNVGIGTRTPTTYSLAGKHLELYGGSDFSFFHNNTATVKSFYAINESSLLAALFTFSAHPLTFGTNNSERMRITSGGQVLINTSTAAGQPYNLVLKAGTGDYLIQFSSNNGTYVGDSYQDGGNGQFHIRNGSCDVYLPRTAGTWVGNSDKTIKENLAIIPNALEKVTQLNGYTYNVIDDKEHSLAGVIAQEVEKVLPQAVHKNFSKNYNREILGVEYNVLIPLLIEAIKELKAEIDELKNK